MRLVRTNAELICQQKGLDGLYKHIELCGRTCYKSTDKITEDSARPFVDRMISSHHTAMLEHGTIYLYDKNWNNSPLEKYKRNKYSKYSDNYLGKEVCQGDTDYEYEYFVTTNLRVLVEHRWLDDLKYLCEPTEHHEKRYTFKMLTSIGVTRELNRHRVNSIAEQSTRYCNYAKDKFGNELTFVMPVWYDMAKYDSYKLNEFDKYLDQAEKLYMFYIYCGMQPQEAREVLPLCTATEICHTAFASDWRHFFDLRLFAKTGNPHPNMLLLAQLMQAEAEKTGIWEDIMSKSSKFE